MSNPTASSFPFPADTPENSTAAPDSLQMHPSIADPLTDILRRGAKDLLAAAVEAEVQQ